MLRAAAGIFAEKGYAATSVREIVAEAELTQPVLYYYFSNKEGLFLGLMNEVADKFDTILGHIAALKGGSRIKLITLFESIGKLHNENMDLVKMMHALLYGPPQAAPNYDFHRFHDRMRGVVRKLVVEGIRNGEFRKMNVGDVMWSLLGILKITLESQLCHPETSPGLSGMKRMLGIFFHGIEKRGRA